MSRNIKDIPPPPPVSEEDQERARRYVAGRAKDAADASLLLQMLGLLETAPKPCAKPSASRYNKGRCRCPGCRQASREYQAQGRAEGRFYQEPKVHGTYSTYCNYRCRCDECKAAAKAFKSAYYERRKRGD